MKKFIFCSIFGLLVSGVSAQNNSFPLYFQSGTVQPTGFDAWNTPWTKEEIKLGKAIRIIQFDQIPSQTKIIFFQSLGVVFLDYLPEKAYFVEIPTATAVAEWKNQGVVAVLSVRNSMKQSPELIRKEYPIWAKNGNNVKISVSAYKNANPSEVEKAMADLDFQIFENQSAYQHWLVEGPSNRLEDLAQLTSIQYLECVSKPGEKEDTEARALHRSSPINNKFNPVARKFNGTGVTVALGDDGIVGPHIDFTGRLTNVATTNTGTHGDMCAGIIGGAGNLDSRAAGMADGAQIINYSINGYAQVVNAPQNFNTTGQTISTTSYSQTCNGGYTADARTIDLQLGANQQLMHVFSGGNQGQANCNYGAGTGWGTITGGYKASKHVMAAGNTTYLGVIDPTSSRGPSADGRIKPDICANGTNQISTDPNNAYAPGGGTSAASPGIAGITAQLYQAYREFNAGRNAPGALLKAVLLNTAEDLGNRGPDYTYGFGRVNAYRALKALEQHTYIDSFLVQGDSINHSIQVPAGTRQVKLMCYWPDTAGAANAAKALVNDIDFKAVNNGITYLPLVLNPARNATTLNSLAVPGRDTLNNAEQIVIDNPTAGFIQLQIKGASIPMGPQRYILVYTFLTDEVKFMAPYGREGFSAGQREVIHWDAVGNSGTFDLAYSLDSGLNWTSIATNLGASIRHYEWTVPSVPATGNGMMRISRNGQFFYPDTTISFINRPTGLRLDWQCADSLRLIWNAVPGASSYRIHELGAKYMDSIGTSTTTGFIVRRTGISTANTWFAITAVGPNGAISERGLAFNKNSSTLNCPVTIDAEALAVVSPAPGRLPSCHGNAQTTVTVVVRNDGTQSISNVPVSFSITGAITASGADTLRRNIDPFDTAWFTFSTPISTTSAGVYTINFQVGLPGDLVSSNNSINSVSTFTASNLISLPYSENFDLLATCATTANCGTGTCALGTANGGIYNEPNGSADDIDFRNTNLATPSAGTGPDVDHTTGTGRFVFLEASACFNRVAKMSTPCISLSGVQMPVLEFWYHMYGVDMGSLSVDILANGELFPNVFQENGDKGNTWRMGQVNLSAFIGKNITITFKGITGGNFASDLAIDDIRVYSSAIAPTAQFTSSKTQDCIGKPISLSDRSINNPTSRKWTITPSTFTFLQGNDTSANPVVAFQALGTYQIKLWVANAFGVDSMILANAVRIISGVPLPLIENFQLGTLPTPNLSVENPDNSNTWALENVTGAGGGTTSAIRVDNFNYNAAGEKDYLSSQPLIIPSGKTTLLTFYRAHAPYNTTTNDSLLVEISTDCGITFGNIAYQKGGSSLASTAVSNRIFRPTAANQWAKDTVNLSSFAGQNILVRFTNITAYGNNTYLDSIQIDTAAPVVQTVVDGATARIVGLTGVINAPTSISGVLKNLGTAVISNQTLTYTVNGGNPVTSAASGTINPGDSTTLAFPTPFAPTTGGSYRICMYPTNLPNDINRNNDTICQVVSSSLAVKNNGPELVIYPNPANSTGFWIELNAPQEIQIFNAMGQLIRKEWIDARSLISGIPSGAYFIQWKNGKQKLIIQ
jgi:PKD repeat protein